MSGWDNLAELGYYPKGDVAKKLLGTQGTGISELFDNILIKDKNKKIPIAQQGLEGATIKFGSSKYNLDTGWKWSHKTSLAAAIGIGDQLGDAWRGIAQVISNNTSLELINTERQDENEKILTALYEDPKYGTPAKVGAVVGALTEPLGFIIPGMKGKKLGSAMLYAATVGGVYGSSLYVSGEENRLTNAALGAALGGPIGYLTHKFFRQTVGKQVDDAVNDVLNKTAKQRYIYKGVDKKTGKPRVQMVKAETALETAAENVVQMETKASLKGPRNQKLAKAQRTVDSFLQPLYDNVKRYSPKVAAGLRKVDQQTHAYQKVWTEELEPFKKFMKGLSPENKKVFHKLLLNEGISTHVLKLAKQIGGDDAVRQFLTVKKVYKNIFKLYKDAGYKIKYREDYFNRSVKDLDSLSHRESSIIDSALASATKRKGKQLTEKEQNTILRTLIEYDPRFSYTSGALKKRKKHLVPDEELDFYHDPTTSLFYYINSAAEDIATRNFFSKFGHKPKEGKGLDVTGSDIDASIDSLVSHIQKEISPKDKTTLVKLLRSRFAGDVHGTSGFIQGIKNLSYAATLGNYWSAATQVGDLVFAIDKYDIASVVASILGPNITTKENLGLVKAMQELSSSDGVTNVIADWAFKWGGFDMIDRFGKNVNINSSLRSNKKLALKNPEKFKDKWGDVFGDETEQVILELQGLKLKKNAKLSDNVNLMLWNDLAETQPIGLSNMPEKYLSNPNGRVLYAYKTFTLTQMNYMRNKLTEKGVNPMMRAYNLTKFATLFVLANSGVDVFKDFIMSDGDLDVEDNIIDNVLGLLGTNKYVVDKSKGYGDIIKEGLTPVPVVQMLDAFSAVTSGDLTAVDVFNQLPVVGKLNKEREFIQ